MYVEGIALTVGALQYCPRVYRGQGGPVGWERHARVHRHSRHEHDGARPSAIAGLRERVRAGPSRVKC